MWGEDCAMPVRETGLDWLRGSLYRIRKFAEKHRRLITLTELGIILAIGILLLVYYLRIQQPNTPSSRAIIIALIVFPALLFLMGLFYSPLFVIALLQRRWRGRKEEH